MNAGSRASNWNNVAWNSNNNIGARFRSDANSIAPGLPKGIRIDQGGQPSRLASANTQPGEGAASRPSKTVSLPIVGKKYRNLFGQIATETNLREAYRRTASGKRLTPGYLLFKEESEEELARLLSEISAGTYQPSAPLEFMVYEPKPRLISALRFRDRIAQHALCNVIEPIFDRVLMARCYACRKGSGVHQGVTRVQAELRRTISRHGSEHVYFLKTDFAKYFPSIHRPTLWREIERKISCAATLRLIEAFLPRTGYGLPIGNLTSQLFANVYGNMFDRWLVEQGALSWHRYMDDVVVIGHDWRGLVDLLKRAESFAAEAMHMKFSRWMVAHHSRGINFLGYRIHERHKLLRRSSVVRAKRKLRHFAKHSLSEKRERFLGAWLGHAGWADSHNLLVSLQLKTATA